MDFDAKAEVIRLGTYACPERHQAESRGSRLATRLLETGDSAKDWIMGHPMSIVDYRRLAQLRNEEAADVLELIADGDFDGALAVVLEREFDHGDYVTNPAPGTGASMAGKLRSIASGGPELEGRTTLYAKQHGNGYHILYWSLTDFYVGAVYVEFDFRPEPAEDFI